ncbi:copper resistance protein CopC [Micromonospora sp. WMMD882]|uniref:copper resistance CopC family protein n=1 Tax=Micromonospora sp. WMMD882 TaxID=3015151 RepID=UPI00248BE420|nr:copper resistance protein CopC [Micromonospora sp. WMMD882]WBB79800.1 copper resistance protein CopC [Micromonospora sp. WMMD882]
MAAGWLVAIVMALGVALWPAAPAAAHNSLTGSDPRDGARLAQPPTRVELRFLARLDPKTTKITLTGPDDVPASRGAPTFEGSRVRVAFAPGAAGRYTVAYQVASSDGHPIKGEIRFTVTTGTPADPSPTTASPTPSAEPSTPAAPTDVATTAPAVEPAADSADDGGPPVWPWVVGAVAVLAALAGGLLARRRSTTR